MISKLPKSIDNQQENISSKGKLFPRQKGRGSISNRTGRFEKHHQQALQDGGLSDKEFSSHNKVLTSLTKDASKTIIT